LSSPIVVHAHRRWASCIDPVDRGELDEQVRDGSWDKECPGGAAFDIIGIGVDGDARIGSDRNVYMLNICWKVAAFYEDPLTS
jgi:hypothetical protein